MLSMLQPSLAESLCEVWAILHKDTEFRIPESEIHYLTSMGLGSDDDIVSHLLLKKVRLARRIEPDPGQPETVGMNSFVEYRYDGDKERFCQLVHPSAHIPSYGLSITSLEGAGLIGLSKGQTILWPNHEGKLLELHVLHVENCPGLGEWLGAPPLPTT
jgi:regulator of nucleoside diphosphate kinase